MPAPYAEFLPDYFSISSTVKDPGIRLGQPCFGRGPNFAPTVKSLLPSGIMAMVRALTMVGRVSTGVK